MNVTFDKTAKQKVFQIFAKDYDMICCSCEQPITAKNFAGAAHDGDKPVFTHKNIVCLIGFSKFLHEEDDEA